MIRSSFLLEPIKIPIDDYRILRICFNHQGKIYGGYLRDLIAGDPPRDYDLIVSIDNFERLKFDYICQGYVLSAVNSEIQHYQFIPIDSQSKSLPIDICVLSEGPDEFLQPPCQLDFDVNSLIYDGKNLDRWDNPKSSLFPILSQINCKTTYSISPCSKARRIKIQKRGYRILASTN